MKTIITLIGLLFCSTIIAQTNYYTETKTFYEDGYTYQCDVSPSKFVTLYNKENKFTYKNQIYKDTGKRFVMPEVGIDLTEDDNWTQTKRHSIVIEAFTEAEKQKVKGHELMTTIIINSNTGKIDEVYFEFVNLQPYATIPISVFRKIELELKKNVWFSPTADGKKLNYILLWWDQDPSEPI